MSTIKNCHSPAGMSFSNAGTRNTTLTDCPGCKYGSLFFLYDKDGATTGMKCLDCGHSYTLTLLTKLGILKKPPSP